MTLLLSETTEHQVEGCTRPATFDQSSRLQTPTLSIVIVNYCQWENTASLVQQICQSPHTQTNNVEVVVVDNHSPGNRFLRQLRRRPGVSLRRWGRNRGFARAVNEGSRLSQGDWLLLLNPDINISEEFLSGVLRLCTQLENEPRAGIVGFQLQDSDGGRQFSWGPFPSLAGTLLRMLLPRRERKYSFADCRVRRQVPWVTGCCLLVRRDCLRQLAGLDVQYFLYYEDVDLCRRAQAHGWTVWFEPRLKATHHHPLHSRKAPPILRFITRHSLLTYAHNHWPRWQTRVLSRIVQAEAGLRRIWARLCGNRHSADVYHQLAGLVNDFRNGRTRQVRARFRRVLRLHENQLASFAREGEL